MTSFPASLLHARVCLPCVISAISISSLFFLVSLSFFVLMYLVHLLLDTQSPSSPQEGKTNLLAGATSSLTSNELDTSPRESSFHCLGRHLVRSRHFYHVSCFMLRSSLALTLRDDALCFEWRQLTILFVLDIFVLLAFGTVNQLAFAAPTNSGKQPVHRRPKPRTKLLVHVLHKICDSNCRRREELLAAAQRPKSIANVGRPPSNNNKAKQGMKCAVHISTESMRFTSVCF